MKKALAMLGIAVAFALPAVVLAADFTGPIVPDCQYNTGDYANGPYCQACDLMTLADNIVKFAVYAATIVAAIMFVYAGFLYVTASANQNNIENAKKIFWTVFLGFIFILGAWLIVDTLMKVFVGDTTHLGQAWKEIKCVAPQGVESAVEHYDANGNLIVDIQRTGTLPADLAAEEARTRSILTACGATVNHDNACTAGQTTGCTTVGGMSDKALTYICNTARACKTTGCAVEVTGGNEAGHDSAHTNGSAVDISHDPVLDAKVRSWEEVTPNHYKDPVTGVIWYDEKVGDTAATTADHWHVCAGGQC